jgi:hypothetical protein
VVYHLFGRVSASPTYVLSDEDLLEFICALQSEHLAPEKLFHELEHNHLLFIGSNFTNWLARLFLRMAKRQRRSDPRDVGEIMADNTTSQDERLVSFLQQVSVRTRIYVGAERFVDELHRRLAARRKLAAQAPAAAGPQRFAPPARDMPDNAVFLSYARDDLAAVPITYAQDDLERAHRAAGESVNRLHAAKTSGSFEANEVAITAYYGLHVMARADYLQDNFAAAEREERQALADRTQWSTEGTQDQRDLAELSIWLAMALAKQGKLTDALGAIAPVVKLQRELATRNHGDVWQPIELAAALYAQALADAAHRSALLKEAAALLEAAAPPLKPLREIRQWRERIRQAQL